MLAAKNLLKELKTAELEPAENCQNMELSEEKKEQELEKVLTFCFGNAIPKHDIVCVDGKIRRFSFEN